jgi:hypothetical protein
VTLFLYRFQDLPGGDQAETVGMEARWIKPHQTVSSVHILLRKTYEDSIWKILIHRYSILPKMLLFLKVKNITQTLLQGFLVLTIFFRRHKTNGGVDSIVGKCKEAMGEEKKLRWIMRE